MKKTVFKIAKMDCPSEETLIRLKLAELTSIHRLDFDIENRKLTVFYKDQLDMISAKIAALDLDDEILLTEALDVAPEAAATNQRQLLIAVLVINFAFFIIEITTGLVSKSMGLVADSLDMLADAFVYGISLYAVGSTVSRKKNIALIAGYFQLILAVIGFVEVVRRFVFAEQLPNFTTMIIVSVLALIGNAVCLYLLQRSKNKDEAHMKASIIFTSNDVIINLGVIIAAVLVYLLKSAIPDLVIGSIVFILVIRGARQILQLAK